MGVCRAMALIGDAKQATGEGKSGPVQTGLTPPAAMGCFTVSTCGFRLLGLLSGCLVQLASTAKITTVSSRNGNHTVLLYLALHALVQGSLETPLNVWLSTGDKEVF